MIAQTEKHPKSDQLVAFGLGKLETADATEIAEHLTTCRECSQTINNLHDDTFVELIKKSPVTVPQTADFASGAIGGESMLGELPSELHEHPRYKILGLIGHGGMGDVYKAQHKLMNRPVALKVIKPQIVQNEAAVERFKREVQAAARLRHANIVTAFDAEQAGDLHYLVMEYVDGKNLHEVVAAQGRLTVSEACDYIGQAAEGLQHAHDMGMVHRDIKPHNLMIERQTGTIMGSAVVVKILDFGLANFANEVAAQELKNLNLPGGPDSKEILNIACNSSMIQLTEAGTMMGTADYIAPEQAQNAHAADIRADIYSLGCTFYTLLTGRPPFDGVSVLDKIKAHSEQEAPPISDFRDDVPQDIAAVLNQMMAKAPDERFQTPAELILALKECRRQIPEPQTQLAPKRSIRRRGPRILVLTTLMGFFFAAMAGIVVFTDKGRLEIQSEVDDVKVVVRENGKEVRTIDLATGSQVTWLPSGKYELELIGSDNDVVLNESGFKMSRLGKVVVTASWNSADRGVIRSFDASDIPIAKNGVEVAESRDSESGWKITVDKTRTVRLFEVPLPPMQPGRFFYRAKLRTAGVSGRAFLEMWVRVPGRGESFSKGFDNAVSGTNGWAEYEIPFFLRKDEQPDLVKLNVTIEGGGTVWIKDIELVGRTVADTDGMAEK